MAIARELLVTIWHMLTEKSNYQYLRQVSCVRKLQEWAYRIGRQHLSAPSSRAFVADRLRELELPLLADALVTSDRNGRLTLAARVT